jgi:hypothetical protein
LTVSLPARELPGPGPHTLTVHLRAGHASSSIVNGEVVKKKRHSSRAARAHQDLARLRCAVVIATRAY